MRALRDQLRVQSPRQLYAYCVLLGLVIGTVTAAFSYALHRMEQFFLADISGLLHQPVSGFFDLPGDGRALWFVLFLPLIGGVVTSLTARKVPEVLAAGTNDLVGAFHDHEGHIRGRVAPALAWTSICALATGSSAGKEGPIAVIGGAIGSTFSRWTGVGARARRTLLLAGAAAGLGAIFRAPLGGALTAVEIPYREDFESDALIPCIIASITAYIVTIVFWGKKTLFDVSRDQMIVSDYRELLLYAVLGSCCVVSGRLFLHLLQETGDWLHSFPVPRVWLPCVGGAAMGLIGLIAPSVLGTGFDKIQTIVDVTTIGDGDFPLFVGMLGMFAIAKMIATAVTVGSGIAGGLFGPSFVIGGTIGAVVGHVGHYFFPGIIVHPSPYVVVGMGVFFATVAHAPLASLIMVTELTGSYELFPAILVAVAISTFFPRRDSLYPRQLRNKFDSPAHAWDMNTDLLFNIRISECHKSLGATAVVKGNDVIRDLRRVAKQHHTGDFVVLDDDRRFLGYVSLRHIDPDVAENLAVRDHLSTTTTTCLPEENLSSVLERLLKSEVNKLAVVDAQNHFLGYLRYRDILNIYIREVRRYKKPGK